MKKILFLFLVASVAQLYSMDLSDHIKQVFTQKLSPNDRQKLTPTVLVVDNDGNARITLDFSYQDITNDDVRKIIPILTELCKEALKNNNYNITIDFSDNSLAEEPIELFEFAKVCGFCRVDLSENTQLNPHDVDFGPFEIPQSSNQNNNHAVTESELSPDALQTLLTNL